MSLLAVSIVMTLVTLSVGSWGWLILAANAAPLRDATRNLLAEPVPDRANERLRLALFSSAVWVLTPAFMSTYAKSLAGVFGMTNDALWPVVLNCLSSSVVLLTVWSVALYVLRDKNPQQTAWTTTSSLRMVRRIQRDCKTGVMGFVLAVLPVAIALVVSQSFRSKQTQHSMLKLLANHPGSATVVCVVLAAVVLAPLVEELVFRVLLQGWLQTLLRPPVAIGIVAVGFSAVHGWPDMLPLIPLACVLGVMFYFTRSYLAVVVTHALFNLTNVVLAVLTVANR